MISHLLHLQLLKLLDGLLKCIPLRLQILQLIHLNFLQFLANLLLVPLDTQDFLLSLNSLLGLL